MPKTRVIPSLLLRNNGLVKGCQFKNHRYVGDPINAVKIFNDKEVNELVFLDITASQEERDPNYSLLRDIASEAFMPFGFGGGISNCSQIETILNLGIEKVVINSACVTSPQIIRDASSIAGSQSVVASIDVRKSLFGKYEVFTGSGSKNTGLNPIEHAKNLESLGAGEIILCSINNEGMGKGYDTNLTKRVADAVSIPVVAVGGAGELNHFREAIDDGHASAVAAGDMFVFHGKHKAVLITYPSPIELENLLRISQAQ